MIALDPSLTVSFTLDSEATLPPERRAVFHARYLTVRQRLRIEQELNAELRSAPDDPEAGVKHALAALEIGLAGWDNLRDARGNPVRFDLQRLPDLLTDFELHELIGTMLRSVRLAESDRKKSSSPSTASATATSAASASHAPPAADAAGPT